MRLDFKRMAATGTCIAVAALGVAGCGGGSSASNTTVSADAYVSTLCTGMQAIAKTMSQGLHAGQSATTPQALKTAIVDYLNNLSTDVSALAAKANSVGVPNVDNGTRIAGAVVSGFKGLEVTLHGLAARAKTLPATNMTSLATSAQTLATKASNALRNVNSLNSGATASPALVRAVQKSATCRALAGG